MKKKAQKLLGLKKTTKDIFLYHSHFSYERISTVHADDNDDADVQEIISHCFSSFFFIKKMTRCSMC